MLPTQLVRELPESSQSFRINPQHLPFLKANSVDQEVRMYVRCVNVGRYQHLTARPSLLCKLHSHAVSGKSVHRFLGVKATGVVMEPVRAGLPVEIPQGHKLPGSKNRRTVNAAHQLLSGLRQSLLLLLHIAHHHRQHTCRLPFVSDEIYRRRLLTPT